MPSGQIQAQQPVGRYLFETKLGANRTGGPIIADNAEKGHDSQARENGDGSG
jgi:hypothetical protein